MIYQMLIVWLIVATIILLTSKSYSAHFYKEITKKYPRHLFINSIKSIPNLNDIYAREEYDIAPAISLLKKSKMSVLVGSYAFVAPLFFSFISFILYNVMRIILDTIGVLPESIHRLDQITYGIKGYILFYTVYFIIGFSCIHFYFAGVLDVLKMIEQKNES